MLDGYCDPGRVMPFASLEFPKGNRKNHGVTGAREPAARGGTRSAHIPMPPTPPVVDEGAVRQGVKTQRVTAKDLEAGRIRVPGASKALFPATRARIRVDLRGVVIDARWDPKFRRPIANVRASNRSLDRPWPPPFAPTNDW